MQIIKQCLFVVFRKKNSIAVISVYKYKAIFLTKPISMLFVLCVNLNIFQHFSENVLSCLEPLST